MTDELALHPDFVPDACTLPTTEQPLRTAEFDELFGEAVIGVDHADPGELRLTLRVSEEYAARAARLAAKETGCCSFFTFTLTIGADALELGVSTEPGQERVLEALAAMARTHAGSAA